VNIAKLPELLQRATRRSLRVHTVNMEGLACATLLGGGYNAGTFGCEARTALRKHRASRVTPKDGAPERRRVVGVAASLRCQASWHQLCKSAKRVSGVCHKIPVGNRLT
jgi:hypothetical protein